MSQEHPDNATRGLYTPSMLAELLKAPLPAIRRWHRRGYLVATCEVRRLPHFAIEEVHVARLLAELLAAGCSLARIDSKVDELARLYPQLARPLCDLPLVIEGQQLLVRQGEQLGEASGQRRLDFEPSTDAPPTAEEEEIPSSLPFAVSVPRGPGDSSAALAPTAMQLREWAAEIAGEGDQRRAIELLRAVLVSGEGTPEDHFTLGELLYRAGEPAAARERYYVAIEIDEDYVEARANLGCVLAELGDLNLAEAALRGALEYHPHYADAHYQLARLLDRQDRADEAALHWEQFRWLAPDSPWGE